MTATTTEHAIVRRVSDPETQLASAMSADQVMSQVKLIQQVMGSVMKDGHHYGKIPGCGDKPTLLKPGAEKLAMVFRLSPTFRVVMTDLGHGHREYSITCTLTHIPTGQIMGEGVGSCSTMESKYRWRESKRHCPECGAEAIIKGKAEYGGGWLCFARRGGCGAKFAEDDDRITGQQLGRTENEDIADTYNTVLKMAKKRAQVDATLTATAASDIFTQDIEEFADVPAAGARPIPAHERWLAEYQEAVAARGFSVEAANGVLAGLLSKIGKPLERTTPAWRKGVLDGVAAGKADGQLGNIDQSHPDPDVPTTDTQPMDEQPSPADAPQAQPANLPKSWGGLLEWAEGFAAERQLDWATVARGLGRHSMILGRKGKEDSITAEHCGEIARAMLAGKFDYETGRLMK